MKKSWILFSALTLLAFAGSLAIVQAKEAKKSKDYTALAAKYDKLAAKQAAIVKEHESMLADTDKQNPGSAKHGGNPMDKHCNSIIKDAKKLQSDYQSFADWCRSMAKEDAVE